MVNEKITASELGAYTNNISNKEGIKKVVKAINDGLEPDLSAYQKKLTAGDNITITEENVISASKTVYEGGIGITIDSSDKINLKGWTSYDRTKYEDLVDKTGTWKTKQDIILGMAYSSTDNLVYMWIPKGMEFYSKKVNFIAPYYRSFVYLGLKDVFNNGGSTTSNTVTSKTYEYISESDGVITIKSGSESLGVTRYDNYISGGGNSYVSVIAYIREVE